MTRRMRAARIVVELVVTALIVAALVGLGLPALAGVAERPLEGNKLTYQARATMPGAGSDCGVVAAGNRLYVIRGVAASGAVRIYTPSTNSWALGPSPLPAARMRNIGPGACVAVKDKIYVVGGHDGSNVKKWVDIYSTTTDAWSTGPDLPIAISYWYGVETVRGLIYAIGGHTGVQRKEVFRLDPNNLAAGWTSRKLKPTATSGFGSAVLDDRIWCLGGNNSSDTPCNVVEVYDPVANTWASRTDLALPSAKTNAPAITYNGHLYLFGGGYNSTTDEVLKLGPWAPAWVAVTRSPRASSNLASERIGAYIYLLDPSDGKLWRCKPADEDWVAGDGPVRIASASTSFSGTHASLCYTLNTRADVTITIRNVSGRVVQDIVRPDSPAGTNITSWNGVSLDGTGVPTGRYLATIVARAGNGSQDSVVTSLDINR